MVPPTTPSVPIIEKLRLAEGFLDVGSPDWILYFNLQYMFIIKRTATTHRWVFDDDVRTSNAPSTDVYGSHQLAALPATRTPVVTLDGTRMEVGSPDWMLVFDPNFFGLVHKTNKRRHLFRGTGVYETDTQGDLHMAQPVVDNGVRLVNGKLNLGGTLARQWMLCFAQDSVAFVNTMTYKRFVYKANGDTLVDADGAAHGDLRLLKAVSGNGAMCFEVGSPHWFIHFKEYMIIVKKTPTTYRYVFGPDGHFGENEEHGSHQLPDLPANATPIATLDSGRLDVGSPDWLLVFDVNFFGLVHRTTMVRHMWRSTGTYMTDSLGAMNLDATPKQDKIKLVNGRLDFGATDWLFHFTASEAAFVNKRTLMRFVYTSDGRNTKDFNGLRAWE